MTDSRDLPAPGPMPGFTLVEVLTVLAVLGILAVVAIPAFNEMIQNNRRTTVVNELLTSLILARSEAAKRGQPVTVCASPPGTSQCSGGSDFGAGWIVFVDEPAPGDGLVAAPGDIISRHANDYPAIRITSVTAGAGHITMQPFNRAGTAAEITVCDKRGAKKARRVCVAINGRAWSSETDCDSDAALTCP